MKKLALLIIILFALTAIPATTSAWPCGCTDVITDSRIVNEGQCVLFHHQVTCNGDSMAIMEYDTMWCSGDLAE